MKKNQTPFRPAPFGMEQVRNFIRWWRVYLLKLRSGKKICFGRNIFFGKSADIRITKEFKTGKNIAFGKNFTCEVNTKIGSNVLISSNVSFVSRDHKFDDPTSNVFSQGRNDSHNIVIEDDVLIGFGTIIIAPVVISKGCIIGAGSVVTRDLPSNMICAGVPAKPIKKRFK